jgi:hypothetical protein
MEQENAQAKLAQGLKLERGDLDALITEFEQLVRHAGYDINQELVLRCYGRLAVVSDVDGGGVCPECRQRIGRSAML